MAEGQGVDRAQQDAGQEQAAAEPSPENVLSGLQVQEKNLRELRRTLFTRLFQLQVSFSVVFFQGRKTGAGGGVVRCLRVGIRVGLRASILLSSAL